MSYNPVPALAVDGIASGEIVESLVPAMNVRSVSLVVSRGNRIESVPDQTLAIGAAPGAGLVRVDMVQWDGTTLSVKVGTAAAIGTVVCPSPDAGNIPLCLVWVPNGATTITNMGRSSLSFGNIFAYYRARTGLFAARMILGSFTVVSTLFVDPDIALPLYFPRNSITTLRGIYQLTGVNSGVVGLRVIMQLDGVDLDADDAIIFTSATADSSNRVSVPNNSPRAGVASGAHRWNPRLQTTGVGQEIRYRSMELQEIL